LGLVLLLLLGVLGPSVVRAGCSTNCGVRNPDAFVQTLPNGESYNSFYSWITSTGILTEGAIIDPKWVAQYSASPNIFFLPSAQPCAVNVTYISSVTSNRNRLGWFLFDRTLPTRAKVINGTQQTLFSDINRSILTAFNQTQPCLTQGSTVTLGPYDSDIGVGFYLDVDGHCGGAAATRLWSLDEENLKYDTTNWNAVTKPYGRTAAVLRVRESFHASAHRALICHLSILTAITPRTGPHNGKSLLWI
jgi:hypothetical protein